MGVAEWVVGLSSLTTFRDHCRAMAADGAHLPDCESLRPARHARPIWEPEFDAAAVMPNRLVWRGTEPAYTPPKCDGCVPEADRALFARMAAEIDTYPGATLWEGA